MVPKVSGSKATALLNQGIRTSTIALLRCRMLLDKSLAILFQEHVSEDNISASQILCLLWTQETFASHETEFDTG